MKLFYLISVYLGAIDMQYFIMAKNSYCQITVRVSSFEYKRFKELKEKHNLSVREILEYSGCPCEKCKGTTVIAYDKNTGEEVLIPKGILSKVKL